MAEGYFNHLCRQAEIDWLAGKSAGIFAENGDAPSPQAVEVMKQLNIDISAHKSSTLNEKLTEEADLVVTMTQAHKENAGAMFPQTRGKIRTLSQYNDENTLRSNIADPFGGSVKTYQNCFREMKKPIENLFLELLAEHKKNKIQH